MPGIGNFLPSQSDLDRARDELKRLESLIATQSKTDSAIPGDEQAGEVTAADTSTGTTETDTAELSDAVKLAIGEVVDTVRAVMSNRESNQGDEKMTDTEKQELIRRAEESEKQALADTARFNKLMAGDACAMSPEDRTWLASEIRKFHASNPNY
jgi:hypothetical protein